MQSNVIQGRIIKSSLKDWDWTFFIDTERYDDASTLYANVDVPEFNRHHSNFDILIEPSMIFEGTRYTYRDSEDGYKYEYREWKESPEVEVRDEDLKYNDGGSEVSEQEFMQETGLSKEELDDLRQQIVEVAPEYFEDWLIENIERFED